MWQKVAKFKGAEYFRKALYIYIYIEREWIRPPFFCVNQELMSMGYQADLKQGFCIFSDWPDEAAAAEHASRPAPTGSANETSRGPGGQLRGRWSAPQPPRNLHRQQHGPQGVILQGEPITHSLHLLSTLNKFHTLNKPSIPQFSLIESVIMFIFQQCRYSS